MPPENGRLQRLLADQRHSRSMLISPLDSWSARTHFHDQLRMQFTRIAERYDPRATGSQCGVPEIK